MDIYKLKFTSLQIEIFRLLCTFAGEKLSQREIAIKLNVSPTAVANSLNLLEKESLIIKKKEKTMNLIHVSLNRDCQKTMQLKRAENLRLVYESEFSEFLENEFPGAAIILFGSYSRGEDIIKSDIDIAIIGSKEKKVNLESYERILYRKINLNFYQSFKEIHKELRENLFNGIVLTGGIEL